MVHLKIISILKGGWLRFRWTYSNWRKITSRLLHSPSYHIFRFIHNSSAKIRTNYYFSDRTFWPIGLGLYYRFIHFDGINRMAYFSKLDCIEANRHQLGHYFSLIETTIVLSFASCWSAQNIVVLLAFDMSCINRKL